MVSNGWKKLKNEKLKTFLSKKIHARKVEGETPFTSILTLDEVV